MSKKRLEEIKEEVEMLRGDMCVTSIEVGTSADSILDDMEWLIEQAELAQKLARFKEYFDELSGEGLEIAYWHKNNNLELFDNFYDAAIESMEDE